MLPPPLLLVLVMEVKAIKTYTAFQNTVYLEEYPCTLEKMCILLLLNVVF